MKICIIANGYPDSHEPQFGCFELDQAVALSRYGHEVSIIYVDGRLRHYKRKFGITHIKNGNIHIYGLYLFPISVLAKICPIFHWWIRKMFLRIPFAKLVKNHGRPNILYAHFLQNISYAAYLKKKYNIPLVGIEHSSALAKVKLTPAQIRIGNYGYSNCDNLISVSKSLQNHIKRHFGKDSLIIHNMIGQDFYNNQVKIENDSTILKIISVGSLLPVKGYDLLLEALYKISSTLPKWRLVLIGDGSEHLNLQKKIEELGLSENVSLLGRKSKDVIVNYLNNSTMYVSSSRSENFSVSIIEALSTGLPVVATDCGGAKECISEQNGLIAPVEDVDGLANAILTMANSIHKYNRLSISENCKNLFGPNAIASQLSNVFSKTVKQK